MQRRQFRDPDRLLPVDGRVRGIARDLYETVASEPIISPHGHVPVEWLVSDDAFSDAADLLISHDHYVTRLLHASGVDLGQLGVGASSAEDSRRIWRAVAEHWDVFAGTASGYWLREALEGVLEVSETLSAESADRIFNQITELLGQDDYRPRALFGRFNIAVFATTEDALDDLKGHAALAQSDLRGRVLPTFRPDKYIDPTLSGYSDHVERLLASQGSPATFSGYLAALEGRRQHFLANGAVSADHGVENLAVVDLDDRDAEQLFAAALAGKATSAERAALQGNMLLRMAEMSVADGLVMTLHPGVLRNHSTSTYRAFGPDTGHDIPVPTDFVRGTRPLLERFGLEKNFHLVLFTVDETTFSREIAPLAGFYPSVYIGAPWWFLDAPYAMKRFRAAVTESAGFSRGSGFIDDTRAFLSIPARHDTSRRVEAAFLAEMVAEARIAIGEAERIIWDLVVEQPKRVFKL